MAKRIAKKAIRAADAKGRLPEKFPPGVVRQAELLAREGIVAVKSGRAGRLTVVS